MATLRVTGLNGIVIEMERRDDTLRARIDRALTAAAAQMQELLRAEGAASFKRPTGELERLIEPGPIWHNPTSSAIAVWAQGNYTGRRGKARRAETVAFVIEHGRKSRGSMAANPWHARAARKGTKRINAIIAEEMSKT